MCFLQIKSNSSNLRIKNYYSIEDKTFKICSRCLVSLFQFSSFLLFSFLFLLSSIIMNCTQCIVRTIFYCWCVSNLSDACGHACLIIMFLLSYMIATKRLRNPASLKRRGAKCFTPSKYLQLWFQEQNIINIETLVCYITFFFFFFFFEICLGKNHVISQKYI